MNRFVKGQELFSDTLNTHTDRVNQLSKDRVTDTRYKPQGKQKDKLRHYRIQSVGDEHLTVKRCDPDGTNVGTETEKIYRAPRMRVSQWDGLTINGTTYTKVTSIQRTACIVCDDSDDETQDVTPDYETPADSWEGDIIKAVKLEKATTLYVGTADEAVVTYEEITDGREWAK